MGLGFRGSGLVLGFRVRGFRGLGFRFFSPPTPNLDGKHPLPPIPHHISEEALILETPKGKKTAVLFMGVHASLREGMSSMMHPL